MKGSKRKNDEMCVNVLSDLSFPTIDEVERDPKRSRSLNWNKEWSDEKKLSVIQRAFNPKVRVSTDVIQELSVDENSENVSKNQVNSNGFTQNSSLARFSILSKIKSSNGIHMFDLDEGDMSQTSSSNDNASEETDSLSSGSNQAVSLSSDSSQTISVYSM